MTLYTYLDNAGSVCWSYVGRAFNEFDNFAYPHKGGEVFVDCIPGGFDGARLDRFSNNIGRLSEFKTLEDALLKLTEEDLLDT